MSWQKKPRKWLPGDMFMSFAQMNQFICEEQTWCFYAGALRHTAALRNMSLIVLRSAYLNGRICRGRINPEWSAYQEAQAERNVAWEMAS